MNAEIILPLSIIAAAGAAGGITAFGILENRFRKKLKKSLDNSEAMEDFNRKWPAEKLNKRSSRMEKLAGLWGREVIRTTGLAPLWSEKLENSPGKKNLRRVLYYCPEDYTCRAFLAGMKNPGLTPVLEEWMIETGPEKSLKLISRSCRGEDFKGTGACDVMKRLLNKNLDPILELTGASEWYARHFAYQLILDTDNPKCRRAAWDGFLDTHPLIRRTLAERFETKEREKLYKQLWNLLVEDPAYEVRKSSKERIKKDFSDLYTPSEKKLKGTPALRFLQLLEDGSPEEINIALDFLKDADLELRFPAAAYLERNGILERLLINSSMKDREEMERSYNLLKSALEVNVASFLKKIGPASDPGTLLTAARLLKEGGDRRMLTPLADAVFGFFSSGNPGPEYMTIYSVLLEGINDRGDDGALRRMREELRTRKADSEYLELLLPAVPVRGDAIFLSTLLEFLKTRDFPSVNSLLDTLEKFPPELLLPDIFIILDGIRSDYPHEVRISALQLLGRLRLPYCLQSILEKLPILPMDEARDFALILNEFPKDEFEKKIAALFKTTDSRIRASIIRILPAIENRTFIKEIRNALTDTDPDVRIAAVEALLSFGELRLLNQETSMLRDPVERVRLATAKVIGKYGVPAALSVLEEILKDKNETAPVKKAAIAGLGSSSTSGSLNLLLGMIDRDSPLKSEVISAMAERKEKKDLSLLIDSFKTGTPALKKDLITVFKTQEKNAEPVLLKLLEEDAPSLKPYIAEILDGTGYIGKTIRKLSHRDVRIRRQAAVWLSRLENTASYRGLVLAARDPDQEIRVLVVKAMDRLNTPAGVEILENLKNDPDRRIRKYTLWAMERLKALALD